ncbi:MAG: matrixin family metalloprotease, partial [Planctomycetes bacterium]|nr:matrixin family metalloprotease [Planctomycetota bacterium]
GGFFLRNTHQPGPADLAYTFGPAMVNWEPIAGDWNGDGIDTVGLQNPATSFFFLRNVHAAGPADEMFGYGPPGAGWMPLAGDWNGSEETTTLRLDTTAAVSVEASPLSPADARSAADAAMARWAVAGLSQSSLDRLAEIDVQVTDLRGDELGLARHGTIYVDRDAAGRGWFVDPTPAEDEEFTSVDGQLVAESGPAHARADLLSVLIHELGHELGLEHVDSDTADVMAETIALGARRVPTPQVVDRIFGEE